MMRSAAAAAARAGGAGANGRYARMQGSILGFSDARRVPLRGRVMWRNRNERFRYKSRWYRAAPPQCSRGPSPLPPRADVDAVEKARLHVRHRVPVLADAEAAVLQQRNALDVIEAYRAGHQHLVDAQHPRARRQAVGERDRPLLLRVHQQIDDALALDPGAAPLVKVENVFRLQAHAEPERQNAAGRRPGDHVEVIREVNLLRLFAGAI